MESAIGHEAMDVLDDGAFARLHRIGGVSLVTQMVSLFLQHGPDRIEQARQGYADSDMRMVEHAAHSLKSSAGNVGAIRLQHVATAVERATETAPDPTLGDLVRALRTEYDAAATALSAKLAEIA